MDLLSKDMNFNMDIINKRCKVIILLPIIYYIYLLNEFAINVPLQDDYGTIIRFINEFFDPSFDKLSLIFAQTANEHRLAFNRIVVLLNYYILGEINFRVLVFIGNMALVAIFYLLYQISNTKNKTLIFISGGLLLFQITHWESMCWAMASLSNYYVLLFALISIYSFFKNTKSGIYLSLLFAILATYTNGNGLFTFYIILIAFLIEKITHLRSPSVLLNRSFSYTYAVYALVTVIVSFLYFFSYTKTAHHQGIWSLLSMPGFFLHHFLLMLGSAFAFGNQLVGTIVGAFILVLAIWLGYRQFYLKNPSLFYFLWFILISVLVASLTRAGFGVLEQALSSRYHLYSSLSVLLLLLAISELIKLKTHSIQWTYTAILLAAIFNTGVLYKNYGFLLERKNTLNTAIHHFAMKEYNSFTSLLVLGNPKKAINNLNNAINKGYYHIPR